MAAWRRLRTLGAIRTFQQLMATAEFEVKQWAHHPHSPLQFWFWP
jgi:hypothetical protein